MITSGGGQSSVSPVESEEAGKTAGSADRSRNSGGYRFVLSPSMTPTFPTIGVSGHTGAVQRLSAAVARKPPEHAPGA